MKASAFTNDILENFDGVAIAELIRSKEVNAEEVTRAAIARAEKVEEQLNAIAETNYENALAAARAGSSGRLPGVPSFIKDNEDVRGMATRHGSHAKSHKPLEKSSRFVEQYESLGFTILGKSTMPELGLTATTESHLHGPTRNPWNLEHSTGGSSGGAAALVAAGVVPIAHGNDGGGSIRIPAACCGLVGLKPSRSRLVDQAGTHLLPINLVHQGVLTRSVRDTAVFMAGAEDFYYNKSLPRLGLVKQPSGRRLRVGFFYDNPEGAGVDKEIIDTVKKTALLLEEQGHNVEQVAYPFDKKGGEYFLIYWGMLAFILKNFGPLIYGLDFDSSRLGPLTRGLSDYFTGNLLKLPELLIALVSFQNDYEKVFKKYDVLLSPMTTTTAPRLGDLGPDVDFETAFNRLRNFVPFTPAQNVSGAPAISLPMGQSESGLPIGVQFASAMGLDKMLLELAYELEEARPFRLLTA